MIVTWRFLSILSLISSTESECSLTSYYRDCWIRRFPGLHVDVAVSQSRGAQLLRIYRGDSAQNCSRTCCLTSNFSCNVAVFHYNTTQDSVNCFHLHCPTLQSCILQQRANVIVYNITKGLDPDLMIFGKPFPSNPQVLPHLALLNISDSSGTDKRQFNRPHTEPSSSAHPIVSATTTKTSTSTPAFSFPIPTTSYLSVSSTKHNPDTLPASEMQQSTTLNLPSQLFSTRIIGNPLTYRTIFSTTKTSPALGSSVQPTFSFTTRQTSSMPQLTHTSSTTITPSHLSSQFTPSSTSSFLAGPLVTTTASTISQTASTEFKTLPYLYISTTFSSGHTSILQSQPGETETVSVPVASSTGNSKTMPLTNNANPQSSIGVTSTLTVPVSSTLQSNTGKTTTTLFTRAPQSITRETTTLPVPYSSILRSRTRNSTTLTAPLSNSLQRNTGETTTRPVPLSSIPQTAKGETTTHTTLAPAQLSSVSLTSIPTFTVVKSLTGYETTTPGPQLMTNRFTTSSWSYNQPVNTQSSVSPPMEKMITLSSTTDGDFQVYTSINLANTLVSVTTISPTTSSIFQSSEAATEINSGLHMSPTTPTVLEDSRPFPNDTKGYISRNVTTGNSPQPVSDGGLTQVWHLAANTILIALATCAALACGCCCSVLMAASWRGRRRRKGRYQTKLKGKKGSMRLIKYVFVRESS